jgi:hypothetical protein
MTTRTDVLTDLHEALGGLEAAMTSGRADRVLAAEGPLATATANLVSLASRPDGVDRHELRRIVLEARLAMARSHTLGTAAAALATAMFPQQGYGPRGLQPFRAWLPSTLATRT